MHTIGKVQYRRNTIWIQNVYEVEYGALESKYTYGYKNDKNWMKNNNRWVGGNINKMEGGSTNKKPNKMAK